MVPVDPSIANKHHTYKHTESAGFHHLLYDAEILRVNLSVKWDKVVESFWTCSFVL